MKNKFVYSIISLVSLVAVLGLQSCGMVRFRYVDTQTGQPIGQQQGYGQQGGQFGPGGRQLQGGQQIIGQKKIAHNHTIKPFVKVGGAAPADVCQSVSESTANEVSLIAQKSVRPGQKPVWPSFSDVTSIAGENFARLGYPLRPGNEGESGAFKVIVYRTGM